ncbi:GntR family transcriptional regulator [Bacillus sp. IITD106]|nr:GntR family transcriptional regulator [Bacillus sp. IITD106]
MEQLPLYKQLKNKILDDITTGVYKPDDMIPSQMYYSKKFDVSRVTVRQAINELVFNGILYTQKGKGTFVKKIPINYLQDNRLRGFTESLKQNNESRQTKLLEINRIYANKMLSKKLELQIGSPIIHIKRLRIADGITIMLENSYLDFSIVKDINFERDFGDNISLYRLLREKADIQFSYTEEEISAVKCDKPISSLLYIEENEPILFIKRVTYLEKGIPLEYCENYIRSDIHSIAIRFDNKD